MVASNSAGTTNGAQLSFTTLPVPPSAITNPATNVTATSATLNGTVNANNTTTTNVHFELRTAGGSSHPSLRYPNVSGTSDTPVSFDVSGLIPNTTYFYRVVAANIAGTVNGGEQSFTTLPVPPSAITKPAKQT